VNSCSTTEVYWKRLINTTAIDFIKSVDMLLEQQKPEISLCYIIHHVCYPDFNHSHSLSFFLLVTYLRDNLAIDSVIHSLLFWNFLKVLQKKLDCQHGHGKKKNWPQPKVFRTRTYSIGTTRTYSIRTTRTILKNQCNSQWGRSLKIVMLIFLMFF